MSRQEITETCQLERLGRTKSILTFHILIVDVWVLIPPTRRLPSECFAAAMRVVVWKRVKSSGKTHVLDHLVN